MVQLLVHHQQLSCCIAHSAWKHLNALLLMSQKLEHITEFVVGDIGCFLLRAFFRLSLFFRDQSALRCLSDLGLDFVFYGVK